MRVKMNIALRKRTLSPVRIVLEDSSKRSFMLFVVVSLQLGSILYIKCNLVVRGSWFVVVVFYVPTVLQYRNFLKIISEDFAHALSSGFLQKCLEEELSSD